MSANIKTAIDELHRAFHIFNKEFYNSELPEPAILIQGKGNRKNVLGWCTVRPIWTNEEIEEQRYEINLVAEYMHRSLKDIMATLLHEMVHLHNLINDIQDVSRSGTYHNKKFKTIAESHGLIIEKAEGIGWSLSEINDTAAMIIERYNINHKAFSLHKLSEWGIPKGEKEGDTEEEPKKKKTRKYICPICETFVKATKEVNIKCGDCDTVMIEEGNEDTTEAIIDNED